jgi:hypothetical protein
VMRCKFVLAKIINCVGYKYCDDPIRDNSVLSPKPLHLVIKR